MSSVRVPSVRALACAAASAALLAGCSLAGSDAATPAATPTTGPASASPSTSDPTPSSSAPSTPASTTSAATPAVTDSATPDPTDDPAVTSATLVFTGEVLMHQSLIDTALHNAGGRNFDFRPMFDGIKNLLTAADLAVCHLELPVIPDGEGMEPRYAAPPQVMDALAYAGFDRCSTASNHALDRGVKGSNATLVAFERVGMTQHGTARKASEAAPTVLDVGGIKVTHLSYTEVRGLPEPGDQPWRLSDASRDKILADVAAARKLGAEWIAVSIHDSDELHYQPTPNQKSWDHWLSDVAKVDLVVGTGSHVPEPVGERDGRFVLYGLGNLINWRLDARDSVIARVRIEKQADGSIRTLTPELIPTFTEESRGYEVLDARTFHAKGLDQRTQADLKAAFRRVDPYVDAWIPKLGF
ncbi:MAG: CapA family protein [Candidatus Nanopelagicales bacterium]